MPATVCGRHDPLWAAVQTGRADCRLGRANPQSQCRVPAPLLAPYSESLAPVPATDLLVDQLSTPIACAPPAREAACIQSQVSALLPVLLEAHCRGLDHWMPEGYSGYGDAQRDVVARVLISLTVSGEPEPLVAHVQTFTGNANARQVLLHDLARLFTYDRDSRAALPTVWRLVLHSELDAVNAGADLLGNRHWVDYALGALVPTAQLRISDQNADDTLEHARPEWLAPGEFSGLADRWITLAAGEPKAADTAATFARTTPKS